MANRGAEKQRRWKADDALLIPPKSVYLSIAATIEAARGRGIAAALTWHGLECLRAEGFDFCLTDWQTANLLASRTWPRFGFETVAYRLARGNQPHDLMGKRLSEAIVAD